MKLVRLILVIAKDVFVEVLIGRFPGADYGNALIGMKGRLSPFLNVAQRQKIFSRSLKIHRFSSKWLGNDPEENDRTPSANIDRIRIAKNTIVSHSSSFSIGYTCFNNKWKAMRQCCVELGGEKFGVTIDSLLTSSFNCDSEQQISELVRNLKENDLQFERSLYKIEDLIRQLIDSIHRGQSCEERETTTHIEECKRNTIDRWVKHINRGNTADNARSECKMKSLELANVIKVLEIPIELGPDRKLNTQMLLSKELLRFYNVKHYWNDAVMNVIKLQSRLSMERQEEEKQKDDTVKSLKSDLQKKVSTIESIFSQVDMESVFLYHIDNEEYKDDKPEDELTDIIYKRENENMSDKDTVDKTVSGVEEDLENVQNYQQKTKLDDERLVKTITREKNLASL
ncbi:unnamed protein product [Mytilus edulis]|uniref:DZIP3-like HEPN domain-containing protein n=1 Tax=Mytilus edulis TaxID=6550 RepID=A0A8S3PYS4_MYTED|nr:unnamed protein product [Mytilus edulis]